MEAVKIGWKAKYMCVLAVTVLPGILLRASAWPAHGRSERSCRSGRLGGVEKALNRHPRSSSRKWGGLNTCSKSEHLDAQAFGLNTEGASRYRSDVIIGELKLFCPDLPPPRAQQPAHPY